ncbi:hypothetical protein NKH77_33650 [Streptomyces sp. M19]
MPHTGPWPGTMTRGSSSPNSSRVRASPLGELSGSSGVLPEKIRSPLIRIRSSGSQP